MDVRYTDVVPVSVCVIVGSKNNSSVFLHISTNECKSLGLFLLVSSS